MDAAEVLLYDVRWTRADGMSTEVYLMGVIHRIDMREPFLEAGQLVVELEKVGDFTAFSKWLQRCSGSFSLIVRRHGTLWLAADIVRSIPLLYFETAKGWVITDNIIRFMDEHGSLPVNRDDLECYVAAGYVLGDRTVFEGVKTVDPGKAVELKTRTSDFTRYFQYIGHARGKETPVHSLDVSKLKAIFHRIFRRMVLSAPEVRNWVVPLSGGHDSRLIGDYLKQMGMTNVICYTYGYAENKQARISRQVAAALGYPWYFSEYTPEKWNHLHREGILEDFLLYAFNGGSFPNLQDFLAIHELRTLGVIGPEDVVVPGHNLSLLSYSDIISFPDYLNMDREDIIRGLSKKHLLFWSNPANAKHNRMVERVFEDSSFQEKYMFDYFNWHERQPKFIASGGRVYDYFNLGWRYPFWDLELVDFFLDIPLEARRTRKLFFAAEENGLLSEELRKIPYAQLSTERKSNASHLEWLKKTMPHQIRSMIARFTRSEILFSEGLDLIFRMEGKSIKDLVKPVSHFPPNVRKLFKGFLQRYPQQVNYHSLTALYTIRKLLDYLNKAS